MWIDGSKIEKIFLFACETFKAAFLRIHQRRMKFAHVANLLMLEDTRKVTSKEFNIQIWNK